MIWSQRSFSRMSRAPARGTTTSYPSWIHLIARRGRSCLETAWLSSPSDIALSCGAPSRERRYISVLGCLCGCRRGADQDAGRRCGLLGQPARLLCASWPSAPLCVGPCKGDRPRKPWGVDHAADVWLEDTGTSEIRSQCDTTTIH